MRPFDFDVTILGAGAAGLMAAIRASERGRRVLLLEKNRKPGVKILMSGGTMFGIRQGQVSQTLKWIRCGEPAADLARPFLERGQSGEVRASHERA